MRYDAAVPVVSQDTSHAILLGLVGGGKRVLDIGCATGYLGEALKRQGCRVTGVEIDETAAVQARERLDEVVVADITSFDLVGHFGPETFDVVVLGDVLEHMADPDAVLQAAARLVRSDGFVTISVPNVAHASVRLALLQGQWRYTELGLLDATHLRFFTFESFLALLARAGLAVVESRPTTADALETEVRVDVAALPPGVVDWVRAQPEAQVYQFVVKAVRDDATRSVGSLGDRLAAASVELAALRSELGRTRDDLDSAHAQAASHIEERLRATAGEDAALAELAALQNTRTLRLTSRLRGGYGRLRRAFGH